jgi:hypothetical protein
VGVLKGTLQEQKDGLFGNFIKKFTLQKRLYVKKNVMIFNKFFYKNVARGLI